MNRKRIAVIGGGINGLMTAWALMELGSAVCLFEAGTVMKATSKASSKMLHGGLRYLEHGHFSLVREALLERRWWLDQNTGLAEPFQMIVPGYKAIGRHPLIVRIGTMIYDLLAIGSQLPASSYLSREETLRAIPGLQADRLLGSVSYWDVRMDDEKLGLWVADQLKSKGLEIRENARVTRITKEGQVHCGDIQETFDAIANVSGPWAMELLEASELECDYRLIAVRGSHLVVNRALQSGCLFQQSDGRVVFYLPYRGMALLGTTECRANPSDPVIPSKEEMTELIAIHAQYIHPAINADEIVESYAGLRPIVLPRDAAASETKSMSRESITVVNGKIVTLLGGKWTTARKQGQAVAQALCRL